MNQLIGQTFTVLQGLSVLSEVTITNLLLVPLLFLNYFLTEHVLCFY